MGPSLRDRIIIAILIIGVCCFALTPAIYLMFRALHWEQGLRVLEFGFFPSFLLFGSAALFAYRRHQARRALLDDDDSAAWDRSDHER
jgi:hypothetical protein